MSLHYMYATMLLHKAGTPITGENIAKVLTAGGIEVDVRETHKIATAIDTWLDPTT